MKLEIKGDIGSILRQQVDGVLASKATSAAHAARAVLCPVHYTHPTASSQKAPDGYRVIVSGCCCEDLQKRAIAARDRALRS
jgi:hypothetical protein